MIGKGIPLAVFYKFNIITKEYTKLFSLHKGIYDFRIIDENRFLLLSSENTIRESWLHEAGGDWEKYAEIAEMESRYFIADEVPFWTNDGGYCNKERGRVYFYDRSGGFCRDMGRGASADRTAEPGCPDGGAEGSLIRLSGDDISIFALIHIKTNTAFFTE